MTLFIYIFAGVLLFAKMTTGRSRRIILPFQVKLSRDQLDAVRSYTQEAKLAERYTGVPVNIILGVIAVESAGRPDHPKGDAGEIGLMQMTPIAFEDLGYDPEDPIPEDPEENIILGATFLALQFSRMSAHFQSPAQILYNGIRAYNGGAAGILAKPNLSAQYAKEVLRWSEQF